MSKVHVKVQMGGAPAAVEAYAEASTPNVIAIESIGNREALLEQPRSPRRASATPTRRSSSSAT